MTTIFTDNLSSGNLDAWTGQGTQNGTVAPSQTQVLPSIKDPKGMVTSTPGWAMEYKDITSAATVYWAARLWKTLKAYLAVKSQSLWNW